MRKFGEQDLKVLEHNTFLVQRLKMPVTGVQLFPTVGWQEVNGKLTERSGKAREGLYAYDYMGSAEFEWGIIPQTIKALWKDQHLLEAFTFKVPKRSFRDCAVPVKAKGKEVLFYGIARKGAAGEVARRVQMMASKTIDLKEYAFTMWHESVTEVIGWFELDNGFYFFTDRLAWEGTFFLYTGRKPEVTTP